MQTSRHPSFVAALVSVVLWSSPAPLAAPAPAEPSPAAPATPDDVSSARWSDIKDTTHEMRAVFFIGLERLEAKLDQQIAALVARRAAMKDFTDTREWDFAMKGLISARSYLQSVGSELTRSSRETWDQDKDKVGRAWVSAQDARDKVLRSTTS